MPALPADLEGKSTQIVHIFGNTQAKLCTARSASLRPNQLYCTLQKKCLTKKGKVDAGRSLALPWKLVIKLLQKLFLSNNAKAFCLGSVHLGRRERGFTLFYGELAHHLFQRVQQRVNGKRLANSEYGLKTGV